MELFKGLLLYRLSSTSVFTALYAFNGTAQDLTTILDDINSCEPTGVESSLTTVPLINCSQLAAAFEAAVSSKVSLIQFAASPINASTLGIKPVKVSGKRLYCLLAEMLLQDFL